MKIDELLDKYFEGETSCEEERELRRFFTEKEVPEHLQTYRPLFAYLNREATSMAAPHVAGAAALLKSSMPNISTITLKRIILSSANRKSVV